MIFFSPCFLSTEVLGSRTKKVSYQMEIIPATDLPRFPRELPRQLALAARFQLLRAAYSWDYTGKAA